MPLASVKLAPGKSIELNWPLLFRNPWVALSALT